MMNSSGGLLDECVQQLKASTYDYEKLLGSCVEGVWRTVGATVERQLRLRKGVGVPLLGKFAFVRDLQPLTPVFLLADRFSSAYGAVWRRPPPALLTPVLELNLFVVGNEAGGLPKDQVSKALEAFLTFVGTKLQKGTASGRLRIGNVGTFSLDGKVVAFHFDTGFIKSISAVSCGDNTKEVKVKELLPNPLAASTFLPTKAPTTIPCAVSIQDLVPVETLKQSAGEDKSHDDKIRHQQRHRNHSSDHRHRRGHRASREEGDAHNPPRRERHTKSMGQLPAPTATSEAESSGQILPRFMLPDPSRSPSKLVYTKQSAALQHTFDFKREELQLQQAAIIKQEDEIDRRTNATRLRCVQERAEKMVNQRELNAFLNMQIESKHQEKRRLAALDATSTNFDAVRVLPRDPIVTKEQRQAAKLKLRSRLHDQVARKDTLAKHRDDVDRAESAYFMSKVMEQGERERNEREELRRITRDALTVGWQQQRAIHDECERLQRRY